MRSMRSDRALRLTTKPEVSPLADTAPFLADLITRRRQIVEMMQAERQREKRAAADHEEY